MKSIAKDVGFLVPGIEYWIVDNPMGREFDEICERMKDQDVPPDTWELLLGHARHYAGALNGYVVFPKRDCPVGMGPRATGILEYVPVHGGITYATKDALGCVFGFDTAHHSSPHLPIAEPKWIKWQCEVMYEGIKLAGKVEPEYRKTRNNLRRAELVQPILDLIPEGEWSMGVMLNVLMGRL